MTFDSAISSLKQGEFVMIHDSDGRENEVDLVDVLSYYFPMCFMSDLPIT
mgnify:CR=1 FL=1